jgi:hypothetical protein
LNHVDLVGACEAKYDLINELEVEFENKVECEEFPKVGDINYLSMGPSMIKYAKKVVVIFFPKNSLFPTLTLKEDIKNLFKLHFEIIEHFIEFIVSCT